ncbi:hypothetical protein Nepgr_031731 [Nepenthes gracilis]|uniref:Uncharacterized protein n=1 Tax=Nepenthes gracilis TaxID=150966 RepID=A0AAD3TJ14_NEPGR|nr:hypothetical protein Nepgr_031731 [Nepenthes gracilis]
MMILCYSPRFVALGFASVGGSAAGRVGVDCVWSECGGGVSVVCVVIQPLCLFVSEDVGYAICFVLRFFVGSRMRFLKWYSHLCVKKDGCRLLVGILVNGRFSEDELFAAAAAFADVGVLISEWDNSASLVKIPVASTPCPGRVGDPPSKFDAQLVAEGLSGCNSPVENVLKVLMDLLPVGADLLVSGNFILTVVLPCMLVLESLHPGLPFLVDASICVGWCSYRWMWNTAAAAYFLDGAVLPAKCELVGTKDLDEAPSFRPPPADAVSLDFGYAGPVGCAQADIFPISDQEVTLLGAFNPGSEPSEIMQDGRGSLSPEVVHQSADSLLESSSGVRFLGIGVAPVQPLPVRMGCEDNPASPLRG